MGDTACSLSFTSPPSYAFATHEQDIVGDVGAFIFFLFDGLYAFPAALMASSWLSPWLYPWLTFVALSVALSVANAHVWAAPERERERVPAGPSWCVLYKPHMGASG